MLNDIEIYVDKDGKSEIEEYFAKLQQSKNKEDRIKANKIRMYMDLLRKYGLKLREPYIKHIKNEIWELRPIRDRFLFACLDNTKFIVLSYFYKKTEKTPRSELRKAQKLLKEYRRDVE